MRRVLSLLRLFGIDVRQCVRALSGLPRFARDLHRFKSLTKTNGEFPRMGRLYPCLKEWQDSSGTASGAYFHQDLFVAQQIFRVNPRRHIDIASRIDGFVAHIATWREIEVIDVRPNRSSAKGIVFHTADILDSTFDWQGVADSVSCLHALEHFGLGRYGDPIDPSGYTVGFKKIANIVEPGGMLYLSVPIGSERTEFNAHRVFSVGTVLALLSVNFDLMDFALVDDSGELILGLDPLGPGARSNFNCSSGCGIFIARKRRSIELNIAAADMAAPTPQRPASFRASTSFS